MLYICPPKWSNVLLVRRRYARKDLSRFSLVVEGGAIKQTEEVSRDASGIPILQRPKTGILALWTLKNQLHIPSDTDCTFS